MVKRLNVLHVLNYGWPHVDGYTIRSAALAGAQESVLGWTPTVVTSPFPAFAAGRDPDFVTPAWRPDRQTRATRHDASGPVGPRRWERPALGLAPVTAPMYRAELVSVMRRTGADLVHAHHPHQSARPALEAARALGLPFVFELRCFNGDYDLDSRLPHHRAQGHRINALELALAREADQVVTIAQGLAERLAKGGVDPARLHVVRNAVDTGRFVPRLPRAPDGTTHLGYATTFARMENLDGFLHAIRLVLDARPALAETLRVTLAGDGQELARIRALSASLGLERVVSLPGFVPYSTMPDFLAGLDLFVVTRGDHAVARRTTPLKPLEALAMGRPVLSTDLPAMRELMNGRADVRFMAPTPEGMAEGVLRYLDGPWSGTGDIGDRAWTSEVVRYRAIYRAAMDRRRERAAAATPPPRRLKERLAQGPLGRLAGVRPPGAHLVICGFPRTGSTLLQLMVESCLPGVRGFDGEVRALDVAGRAMRGARTLVTKRPDDVADIAAIRAACRAAGTRPVFVVLVRDPADCLTSTHKAYPATRGYYLSPERWASIYDAIRAVETDPDVLILRYEDLVTDPASAEAGITEALGVPASRPFAAWQEGAAARARDSMTEGALGGLRSLDAAGIGRGAGPEHAARLAEVEAALPQLPEMRARFGYGRADAA